MECPLFVRSMESARTTAAALPIGPEVSCVNQSALSILVINQSEHRIKKILFVSGAGGVARKALQALEGLKLVEKDQAGGRRMTAQGRRDLDRIAAQIRSKAKAQVAA